MTDLEWESAGGSADEPGRALVWAHGLTSSRMGDGHGALVHVPPAAVEAGYRLVRYDARGHGTSPAPLDEQPYRWDRLAIDMLAVADAAGVARFCAAGASMGAATSLFAALEAPERVEALVLVTAPTAWESRADQRANYEKLAAIVEAKGLDRLVSLSASQRPTTMFGDEGKARSVANLAAMDPVAYPYVMRGAAASDLPDPDAIRTIAVPTLLLAWTGDAGHPVSTAERLDDLMPNCDLHIAASPAEVAAWPAMVRDFLGALR